jgi:hypothetical protein
MSRPSRQKEQTMNTQHLPTRGQDQNAPALPAEAIWSLLWSHSGNCLHIEEHDRTLEANRDAFLKNRGGDYRVLVVGTRDEVDAAADALQAEMQRRQEARV